MSNLAGSNDTKVYVCATPVTSATDTAAEFAALTWVEVGGVTSIGEFGDQATSIKSNVISENRVRKLKGSRDAGTLALVCNNDPLDAGQIALLAAEATSFRYGVKVEIPDAQSPTYSDSIFYFAALVMSKQLSVGEADKVISRTFSLDIDSPIVEVPSKVTP
jgi:hypothetical protein